MKNHCKRLLSLVLALVMVLGMFPSFALHADAATTTDFTGSTVDGLGISATNANGSGTGDNAPVCSWVASGTNITGSLVGGKDPEGPRTYYYESTTVLTLTNNKKSEAELSFTYSVTTSGSAYGDITVNGQKHTSSVTNKEVSVTLDAGESITVTLHVPERNKWGYSLPDPNGASITITDLALVVDNSVSVNFAEAQNGSYTVTKADGTKVDLTQTLSAQSVDRFTLTATPADGYAFAGWYFTPTGGTETFYYGAQTATNRMFTEDGTLTPKFVSMDSGIWYVDGAIFDEFDNALSAAKNSEDGVVVLYNDYTLTEDLTIPAGVTVLIPFDDDYTVGGADPEVLEVPDGYGYGSNYYVYRTLTIEDGVTLTVNGNLEVGADHRACHGGRVDGGTPYDYYGKIVMENGSKIQINNGGNLYAWGYITGTNDAIAAGNVTATVTAESGAKIYEKMQVSDYRGGNITSAIVLQNCFPFNQYYIQNVEVKEVLKYGSTLVAHAGIYGSGVESSSIDFMGSSDAMFTMTSGTVVTKFYDHLTDRLVINVEGNVSMNAISIMGYDTSGFILPFNHNITVNLKSGTATINQNIMLQPGATFNISKGAKLVLASGKKLILMDNEDWGIYCFGKQLEQVSYVPYYNGTPNIRQSGSWGAAKNMGDATLNINGTMEVNGTLYASATGAKIISSDETGVINFKSAAATADITFKQSTVQGYSFGNNTVNVTVKPAKLTNGNDTQVDTTGIAASTVYNFCANCDKWGTDPHKIQINFVNYDGTDLEEGGEYCMEAAVSYLGKEPSKESDAQYVYTFAGWTSSLDTAEVKTVYASNALPNATESVTYSASYTQGIRSYEVTWYNDAGDSELLSGEWEYGSVPYYIVSDDTPQPTKAEDAQYKYTFAGWSTVPNGEGTVYGIDDELPAVAGDVAYYAYFTAEAKATDVTVTDYTKGAVSYTVNGNVVTVTHTAACKVGYLVDGSYVAISAVPNTDGSYGFTAPEGVTEVILVVKGDVTGDGKVNITDRTSLAKSLLGKTHANYIALAENWQVFAADVTGDGKVTIADRTTLAKSLLGKTHNNYVPLTW